MNVLVSGVTNLFLQLLITGDDPLEPVEQDPDAVREQACRLLSPDDSICVPPDTIPPNQGSGSGFSLGWLGALLWLLLIALLIIVVVSLLRLRSTGGRSKRKRAGKGDDDELDEVEQAAVAIDRSREPTNWRAEADEHRRAGRYRDALRCRYRALVGDLARRGLIDEIPGRTTGEERTQLHEVRPTAGPPFATAADLFDGAWYGHVAVDADDDELFQSLERDVLSSTTARR